MGQGLFFPIEANHIFPFFVPKRSFLFDQIRSWLLIFSFVYIPPYQAALLDLFENKYTFSQGSTPDFIGNLIFQNSSQNSFLWRTIFIMDDALHLKSCPITHIALDVLKKDCFLTNWFKTCKDASAKKWISEIPRVSFYFFLIMQQQTEYHISRYPFTFSHSWSLGQSPYTKPETIQDIRK